MKYSDKTGVLYHTIEIKLNTMVRRLKIRSKFVT